MIDFVCFNLHFSLYIANASKWQTFTVHTVHLWYELAESHVMSGTNC